MWGEEGREWWGKKRRVFISAEKSKIIKFELAENEVTEAPRKGSSTGNLLGGASEHRVNPFCEDGNRGKPPQNDGLLERFPVLKMKLPAPGSQRLLGPLHTAGGGRAGTTAQTFLPFLPFLPSF